MPTIGSDTRITERVTLPNHVTTSISSGISTGISTAPTSIVYTIGNTALLPAYTAAQHLLMHSFTTAHLSNIRIV